MTAGRAGGGGGGGDGGGGGAQGGAFPTSNGRDGGGGSVVVAEPPPAEDKDAGGEAPPRRNALEGWKKTEGTRVPVVGSEFEGISATHRSTVPGLSFRWHRRPRRQVRNAQQRRGRSRTQHHPPNSRAGARNEAYSTRDARAGPARGGIREADGSRSGETPACVFARNLLIAAFPVRRRLPPLRETHRGL